MPASTVSIIRADGTTLTFDAAVDYTISPSVTVTEHPVENGSDVADHAQRKADILSVRGIVTETPYSDVDSTGGPDRVQRAIDFLNGSASQLLSVVTGRFGTFESMVMTRWPTTATQLRRQVFDIEFKQLVLAEAGLVDIPPEAPTTDAASAGMPDEQDVGEQPTTDTADEPVQEEGDKSTLLEISEALGFEP